MDCLFYFFPLSADYQERLSHAVCNILWTFVCKLQCFTNALSILNTCMFTYETRSCKDVLLCVNVFPLLFFPVFTQDWSFLCSVLASTDSLCLCLCLCRHIFIIIREFHKRSGLNSIPSRALYE